MAKTVKIESLKRGTQTRDADSEKDVSDILPSIKRFGILTPLEVRQDGKSYVVVDGYRRWNCAKKLKLKEVPVTFEIEASTKVNKVVASYVKNTLRTSHESGAMIASEMLKMSKEGKSYDNIAAEFGVAERNVRNLLSQWKRLKPQWAVALKEGWSKTRIEKEVGKLTEPQQTVTDEETEDERPQPDMKKVKQAVYDCITAVLDDEDAIKERADRILKLYEGNGDGMDCLRLVQSYLYVEQDGNEKVEKVLASALGLKHKSFK